MATGCDNVTWGGIDVNLMPPPSAPGTTDDDVSGSERPSAPEVHGPLLLAGLREGPRATLVVVGEIQGDALAEVPDTTSPEDFQGVARLTAPGSEWTLFSEGVRIGSLTADSTAVSRDFCPPRATLSGVVELVPPANAAERLLALPAEIGRLREYEPFRPLSDGYDQRVATLSLAGEAIPRLGASWPGEGLLAARRDIQVFELAGTVGPSIAATFLYRDQLAVDPPGQGAYALFLLGSQSGDTYREAYVWYRAVDADGKGAPRYFNHLDWDLDGSAEILLDVFGSNRRWFAGLARRGGQWVRTFQDVCGGGSSAQP